MTMTIKVALSLSFTNHHDQHLPAARVRARAGDQPESELTAVEERAFPSSLCQCTQMIGHLSCHSFARATRVAGGSTAAVHAKVCLKCAHFCGSLFCDRTKTVGPWANAASAAQRGRMRCQRCHWRHEQLSVRMAVVAVASSQHR